MLSFAYPVNAYLQSVKAENHDHPELPRRASWVAVYRKNYEVWRLDLGRPAYEFLRALAKGRPFGKAVAQAARGLQGNAGDQIFRWLRDWVAEGMFESVGCLAASEASPTRRDTLARVNACDDASREWLEADGLGGFASGTVRRHPHAALPRAAADRAPPPTDRFVLVNGFDAWVETPAGASR